MPGRALWGLERVTLFALALVLHRGDPLVERR